MLGPLLEVEMSKKCTPLWREAHFEVKMVKAPGVRTTFGGLDVASRGRRKGLCTLSKVSKTKRFCSIFNYTHHYTTLHSIHYNYNYTFTTFHYATLPYTTLHSIALNYTQLHYVTLHSTTLFHYTSLHYTTLHSTTLQIQLHSTTLHSTKLHCATLHYTTLHSTTPPYTTLHYTTLYSLLFNWQRTRSLNLNDRLVNDVEKGYGPLIL